MRTRLEIKKNVSIVKTKNDEFALRVTLKMRACRMLEDVTLIDKIPYMLMIYKKFGIVKPDKFDVARRRIHWRVGDINVGETRVFNYNVYSKVGLVGQFSLPEAVAVFKVDGKVSEADSNKVFFMNDQVRHD